MWVIGVKGTFWREDVDRLGLICGNLAKLAKLERKRKEVLMGGASHFGGTRVEEPSGGRNQTTE